MLASEIAKVFLIGLSSRLLIFGVALLTSIFYNSSKIVSTIPLVNFYSQWDGAWYTQIALFGYPAGSNPLSGNWAFFPLYPFLMRVFGTPFYGLMSSTEAVLFSGFLISNILFFISLFLFYHVTKIILAKAVLLWFQLFSSFFGRAPYFIPQCILRAYS